MNNNLYYFHTTFRGSSINDWNVITINFDKTFKYPPLVSITLPNPLINSGNPIYWQQTLEPYYVVTTTYVTIAYYVRDSAWYDYDVNAIGEIVD